MRKSSTPILKSSKPAAHRQFPPGSLAAHFMANLQSLKSRLNHWFRSKRRADNGQDPLELYLDWTKVEGADTSKIDLEEETQESIMRGANVYENLNLLWRITYHPQALQELYQVSVETRAVIIERVLELASGVMTFGVNCEGIMNDPMIALRSSLKEKSIVFILEQTSEEGIAGTILVLDCVTKNWTTVLGRYMNTILKIPLEMREFNKYQFFASVTVLPSSRIAPKSHSYDETFDFSLVQKKKISIQSSYALLSFLSSPSSYQGIAKTLQRMYTVAFHFTPEEIDLISAQGNVLAIGRSGTGKTICALFRLFGREMVYRYHMKRILVGEATRLEKPDVDTTTDLHQVFVTASSNLTLLVQQSYKHLTKGMKSELESRAARKEGKVPVTQEDSVSRSRETRENLRSQEVERSLNLSVFSDADFPAFFTLKQILYAIDASLHVPFFTRSDTGTMMSIGPKAARNKQLEGSYLIQGLDPRKPTESFEVNFQYFAAHFWPIVKSDANLFDATQVWFEIAAVIKGSVTSYCFTESHLPKDIYITQGNKNTLLTTSEKEVIWEMFQKYSIWKQEERAYDIQDVVNYALCEISKEGYRGAPIHCLMIDEVQDLTPAMLLLLWKMTSHQIFLSGDTAQTIAKGVGFRFKDINSICRYDDELRKNPPRLKQLTTNFRSHQQILNLGNHLVSVIQMLFPKLIDKLEPEKSPNQGSKPVVVQNVNQESLIPILYTGKSDVHDSSSWFGSDLAIIVRDNASKSALPVCLQEAISITIYDSKGLEFTDVLLYDFFSTSSVEESDWHLINLLFLDQVSNHAIENVSGNKRKAVEKMECTALSKHAEMCADLKMLYVGVTRAKKRLVIYESDCRKARSVLDTWKTLGLVDVVESPETVGGLFSASVQPDKQTLLNSWKAQGDTFMRNKLYLEAAKCYKKAGEKSREKEANACALADEGSELLNLASAMLSKSSLQPRDRDIAIQKRGEAYSKLSNAANLFDQLRMYKSSGQCHFSCREYQLAVEKFTQGKAWQECAESYIQLDKYVEAALCYEKNQDYQRAIACYKERGLWWEILMCILRFAARMRREKLLSYAYHYLEEFCKHVLYQPTTLGRLEDNQKVSSLTEISEELEKDESFNCGELEERTENSGIGELQFMTLFSRPDLDVEGSPELVSVRQRAERIVSELLTDLVEASLMESRVHLSDAQSSYSLLSKQIINSFSVIGLDSSLGESSHSQQLLRETLCDLSEVVMREDSGTPNSDYSLISLDPNCDSFVHLSDNASNSSFTLISPEASSEILFQSGAEEEKKPILPSESGSFELISGTQPSYIANSVNNFQSEQRESITSIDSRSASFSTFNPPDQQFYLDSQFLSNESQGDNESLGTLIVSASYIGRNIYDAVNLYAAFITDILQLSKSRSILSEDWCYESGSLQGKNMLSAFELLEFFNCPMASVTMAYEYGLPNLLKHCLIGLAQMLAKSEVVNPNSVLKPSKRKEMTRLAEKANDTLVHSVKSFDHIMITGSSVKCLEFKQGLLLLGYANVLFRLLDESEKAVLYKSVGCFIQEHGSRYDTIDHLFYCIGECQTAYPLCHTDTPIQSMRLPQFPAGFPFNIALWKFLKGEGCKSTFIDLLDKSRASLERSLDGANLPALADICSGLVQLTYAHVKEKITYLLTDLDFETFANFMRSVRLCMKLLKGRSKYVFTTRSVEFWPIAIESLFVPLRIYRLHASDLTNCFPVHSFFLMHRSSFLFPDLVRTCKDNDTLLPYDLEGQFFLVQIDDAANLLCQYFLRVLCTLVCMRNNRFSRLEKYQCNTELKDWNKMEHFINFVNEKPLLACTVANLTGEIVFVLRTQLILGEKCIIPAEMIHTGNLEVARLHRRLACLEGMAFGDEEDEQFIKYMQDRNEIKIKEVREKLRSLMAEEYQFLYFTLLEYKSKLNRYVTWMSSDYPITAIAKKGLLWDCGNQLYGMIAQDRLSFVRFDKIFHICNSRSFLYERWNELPVYQEHCSGLVHDYGIPLFPRELLADPDYSKLVNWCLRAEHYLEVMQRAEHVFDADVDETVEMFNDADARVERFKLLMMSTFFSILQLSGVILLPRQFLSEFEINVNESDCTAKYQWTVTKNQDQGVNGLERTFSALTKLRQEFLWKDSTSLIPDSILIRLILYSLLNSGVEIQYIDELLKVKDFSIASRLLLAKKMCAFVEEYLDEESPDELFILKIQRVPKELSQTVEKPEPNPLNFDDEGSVLRNLEKDYKEVNACDLCDLHFFASVIGTNIHKLRHLCDYHKYQEQVSEMIKTLRYGCNNQRDTQYILRLITESSRCWNRIETALAQNVGPKDCPEVYLANQELKEVMQRFEMWKGRKDTIPEWKDVEAILPKKVD